MRFVKLSNAGRKSANRVRFPATTLDEVFGCMRSKRKATLAQMDAAIVRERRRRHRLGRY